MAESRSDDPRAPRTLLDHIEALWPRDGWHIQRLEEPACLVARYDADGDASWPVFARVEEEMRIIGVYSIFPRACPADRRPAALEVISRANADLLVGNFEYSFELDEIRFKTSLDLADGELSAATWRALVSANVLIMERYFPALASVLDGESTPEEAVRAAESS